MWLRSHVSRSSLCAGNCGKGTMRVAAAIPTSQSPFMVFVACCPSVGIDAASMAAIKGQLLPCDCGCARCLCPHRLPHSRSADFASVLPPLAGSARCLAFGVFPLELGRPLQLQRASIDRIKTAATHSHSSRHGALPSINAALAGMRNSPKATACTNAADGMDVLGDLPMRN